MVSHRRCIGARPIGDGDTACCRCRKVNLLIAGTNHTDDFQVWQCRHFIGIQAQRPARKHRIDFTAMASNGLAP